jgi:hypothetical protein
MIESNAIREERRENRKNNVPSVFVMDSVEKK